MNSYSITENPFVYGLTRTSYQETSDKFSPSKPLGKIADGSYFAARTIRFGLSIVGTVVDLALQLFEIILLTPSILIVKGEAFLRQCKADETYSLVGIFPAICILQIREITTGYQLYNLAEDIELIAQFVKAEDIELIAQYVKTVRFSSIYFSIYEE